MKFMVAQIVSWDQSCRLLAISLESVFSSNLLWLSLVWCLPLCFYLIFSSSDTIFLVQHAFLPSFCLSHSSHSTHCLTPPICSRYLVTFLFCEGTCMNYLESSMYPNFYGLVKYRLVIRFSMSKIDISVNTYHFPLVVTGLSHSGWYFQVPSIFLQISGVHPSPTE